MPWHRKFLSHVTDLVACGTCGREGLRFAYDAAMDCKTMPRHLAPCGAICVVGSLFDQPWPEESDLHRKESCPVCGNRMKRGRRPGVRERDLRRP